MVCSPAEAGIGYRGTMVIDARTDGSVVLMSASEYLDHPGKYDVAVKRLETDWFNTAALDIRGRICNIALNEVDIEIGLRFVKVIDRVIRQGTVIVRFVRHKARLPYRPPRLPPSIRPAQFKAFTCGGFVQWCYYSGVSKVAAETGAREPWLQDVTFNPRIKQEASPFDLLTTSPADLANCDRLSWKYVAKDGVVEELASAAENRLGHASTPQPGRMVG
jgi:hypothetical protein